MTDAVRPTRIPEAGVSARRPWSFPALTELPKLTKLTLASAIGGGGGTGSGGSTVFTPFLVASALVASSLVGCSSDRTGPSEGVVPRNVATVTCHASVTTGTVECGDPSAAPGTEQLGGQGSYVVLRSRDVAYDNVSEFTFGVTVQNLTAQTLGWDGTDTTGVRIFFVTPPTVTAGSGTITVEDDSVGNFTASNQSYYLFPQAIGRNQESDVSDWRFSMPPTVTSFTFTVLVAADIPDFGGVLKWKEVPGVGNYSYRAVASVGMNDAMAAATGGVLFKWNGSTWTRIASPSPWEITGLVAERGGTYVASDSMGGSFRYSNGIWHAFPVDGIGKVRFVDLDHWVSVRSLGGPYYSFVHSDFGERSTIADFESVSSDYAQTSDGNTRTFIGSTYVYYYHSVDGGPFVYQGLYANGLTDLPTGVMYDDQDDIFFAYTTPISPFTVGMVRRNPSDTIWKVANEIPSNLWNAGGTTFYMAVTGAAGTRVVKVDYADFPVVDTVSVTDNFPSTFAYSMDEGRRVIPRDEGMTDWFGLDEASQLWMSEGGNFSKVGAAVGGALDSWGHLNTTWLVDGSTTVTRLVGTTRTTYTAPFMPTLIYGISPTEIYLASNSGELYLWDGGSTFTSEHSLTGDGYADIWADPVSGTIIGVGQNGTIAQRVAGVWTEQTGIVTGPMGVWGCAASLAWIPTVEGKIYRWESGTIVEDVAFAGSFTPPSYLRTLGGNSCTDLWVGGDVSALYHWDGTSWSDQTTALAFPTNGTVFAIIGVGNGEALVGGVEGLIARMNGTGRVDVTKAPVGNTAIMNLYQKTDLELVVGAWTTVVVGAR